MNVYTSLPAVSAAETATIMTRASADAPDRLDPSLLSPAELVAGPCALPDAPMAMPAQPLEHEPGRLKRMLMVLLPQPARAPGRG